MIGAKGRGMHYEIAPDLPAPWRAALVALATAWDESVEVQAALWRMAPHGPPRQYSCLLQAGSSSRLLSCGRAHM